MDVMWLVYITCWFSNIFPLFFLRTFLKNSPNHGLEQLKVFENLPSDKRSLRKKNWSPDKGLEPLTSGLKVPRSTDWANRAVQFWIKKNTEFCCFYHCFASYLLSCYSFAWFLINLLWYHEISYPSNSLAGCHIEKCLNQTNFDSDACVRRIYLPILICLSKNVGHVYITQTFS